MEKIREEILKMIEKIGPLIAKIEVKDDKGDEMLENMKAYIADSKHFLKNENFLKSFESIVFAYGILETCIELGVFAVEPP